MKIRERLDNILEDYHQGKIDLLEVRKEVLILFDVSNLFDHKTIESIRNSSSDAEARRILKMLWLK